MRAWIQSSLFGVPLPREYCLRVQNQQRVAAGEPRAAPRGHEEGVGAGMAGACVPEGAGEPKRSTMRLASATSRLSVPSAPRRLFALLMFRLAPQGEQRFGDDRRPLVPVIP